MIKALSIMELFQVIERYIRQSGLNFQKCYDHDRNMGGGGRGHQGLIIGLGAGGRINLIAVVRQLVRQLIYTIFITNNHV